MSLQHLSKAPADHRQVARDRVLFVVGSLSGGGIARTVSTLANTWAQSGRPVAVLTLDARGVRAQYALDEGVDCYFADLLGNSHGAMDAVKRNVCRILGLRRLILNSESEVVVSFGDQTNVLVLLALMGTGIPVIVSERIDPRHHQVGRIWSALRDVTYDLAGRVVVQTEEVSSVLPRRIREKVVTIPNPVPLPGCFAKPGCIGTAGPVAVAMGRLHRQKGFDLLLKAFALVADRRPEWSLVIWGEGPARGELERQREALGLSDRVRFAGVTEDPAAELAAANLFVLSSRYEGFPNALCEAMAVGLPVVSTDCESGPASIVHTGEDGILVPVEDVNSLAEAMETLMEDEDLRVRLGAKARGIVNRFSVARVVSQWQDIIDHVA